MMDLDRALAVKHFFQEMQRDQLDEFDKQMIALADSTISNAVFAEKRKWQRLAKQYPSTTGEPPHDPDQC